MSVDKIISAEEMKNITISVHEPFAEFLMADKDEYKFSISLLDSVRFAGHACPAMVGAFLIAKRAVEELYPKTNILVRGEVSVEIPNAVTQGATGPMSNVFSMIFGAWESSGFGGLQGHFSRRNLLKYEASEVPAGAFRFRNLATNEAVDIFYTPSRAKVPAESNDLPFQRIWRHKITKILENPTDVIESRRVIFQSQGGSL